MNADDNRKAGATMTAKQLRVVSQIDAAMRQLTDAGKNDLAIFAAMGRHMADFKWLVDGAELTTMDELCQRYTGLFHYATLLESIANSLKSGVIKAPQR